MFTGVVMDSVQLFGVLVFSLGTLLFITGLITVFFAGKGVLELLFGLGILACALGAAIILVSVAVERLRDLKRDREVFKKMEGRK